MKIKGIVIIIIITNVIVGSPKDGVASPITDGFKLLEMMDHQSDEVKNYIITETPKGFQLSLAHLRGFLFIDI